MTLKRTGIKRPRFKPKPKDTGPDAKTKAALSLRSGGMCETGCGRRAVERQHRRARGAGGTTWPGINLLSNLLHLCRWHHAWAETRDEKAQQAGLWVSRYTDPALVPLRIPGRDPVWLTDDGDYTTTPPTERTHA